MAERLRRIRPGEPGRFRHHYQPTEDSESQLSDPPNARKIDEFHVVAGAVIFFVKAREETYEWNPNLPEANMVGAARTTLLGEDKVEIRFVGVGDQRAPN